MACRLVRAHESEMHRIEMVVIGVNRADRLRYLVLNMSSRGMMMKMRDADKGVAHANSTRFVLAKADDDVCPSRQTWTGHGPQQESTGEGAVEPGFGLSSD